MINAYLMLNIVFEEIPKSDLLYMIVNVNFRLSTLRETNIL
jgi:hypothetical protein